MAQQIRNGLHRHIPAHHLGRVTVCRKTWASGRGTVTPARRSARWATSVTFRAVELPIRGPRGCEDHVGRAGRGPRAQRGDQGLPDVGGQWQLVAPVLLCRLHGRSRCASRRRSPRGRRPLPARRPSRINSSRMARSRRPLRRVTRPPRPAPAGRLRRRRRGAVAACFHWRMVGTAPSMPAANHTAGGEEAQKRPGGGEQGSAAGRLDRAGWPASARTPRSSAR